MKKSYLVIYKKETGSGNKFRPVNVKTGKTVFRLKDATKYSEAKEHEVRNECFRLNLEDPANDYTCRTVNI